MRKRWEYKRFMIKELAWPGGFSVIVDVVVSISQPEKVRFAQDLRLVCNLF